ncbi:MAG: histidine kinase [Oscillospiraceae bacterium]|nr:histidine kinase [Oscillospiraceae bacterium]
MRQDTPKEERAGQAFRGRRGRLSLKTKMTGSMLVFSISALLVLWFAFYQVQVTLRQSDTRSNIYYGLNEFVDGFTVMREQLNAYIRSGGKDAAALHACNAAAAGAETFLDTVPADIDRMSEEQYLLQRALKNSYEVYRQKKNSVLARLGTASHHAAMEDYYQYVAPGGEYIETYARQLLRQVLREDKSFFEARRHETQLFYLACILLAVLLFLGTGILLYHMLAGMVRPILKLSKASDEISQGNFDVEDVTVKNRDELSRLALAFNNMKRSMKAYIETLQEKNQIAQRLHQAQIDTVEAQKRMEQAKMAQLQSQINPHFLFNTLNVISRTARLEKAPQSEKLILSLARLFRHSLKTDGGLVTVRQEMDLIDDYMSIQQTRFGSRVGLLWRVSGTLDPETERMPTFLLQPVVENAIIHGLEPKIDGGSIRVRIQKRNGFLVVIVSDNGVGMDHETLQGLMDAARPVRGDVSGIGVSNVAQRLRLLGAPDGFTIHSRKGRGTSVKLRIPCEDNMIHHLQEGE